MKMYTAYDLQAVLRTDFQAFSERAFMTLNPTETFLDNWSLQVIAHHLNLCARREIRRLLILVPPRSLKSMMASVAFPAYLLGRDPSTKVIAISYSHDLSKKFSNDTRSIIKSNWYSELFPHTRISQYKDTQSDFETTKHGARFATSVEGALTGLGSDFIIIDDPLKANEANSESARKNVNEWHDNSVLSRLNDPKLGVVIVVMQRHHVDDLAGHLIEQGGWTVLKIPAFAETDTVYQLSNGKTYTYRAGEFLHPARLGQKELDERRNSMGTAAFYAQYQQAPIPPAGNIFKWEWFKQIDKPPEFSELVMSVDVAASINGNYSAFTILGHRDGNWCLIAVYRNKLELPAVRQRLLDLDKQYRPDLVVVDGVGVGYGLFQELRSRGFLHVEKTSGNGKIVDAHAILPMIEGGRVSVLANCPGLVDFRNEVIAFPDGKYDDQVDSMVQLLRREAGVLRIANQFKRPERKHLKSKPQYLKASLTLIEAGPRRLFRYS
jgi:predicted phage terminase large subunit-like protein